MAEIKINQLKSEKETNEIIDLKNVEKDSPEFTAFTTVRGGLSMATTKWSFNLMM